MAPLVDHVLYNSLPSLEEANISRQVPSMNDTINGPIRDVFLKHGAYVTYCLYLQHRHHSINLDTTVVKVEGTAHVMDDQAISDIVSFGNKVAPTTWMTSGDSILPMEFGVVPAEDTIPAPGTAFISDLLSVLASNGCTDVFGIDTIAKYAWSEMTIGDSSVVVPSNDSDNYDQDRFIPVAFAFDKDKPAYKVHALQQYQIQ
ncbi:3-hydroxybutyryl- dehydratase [Ophiostoma piceae UAMH 11346]|uniref:3-hydroxybutyryl-dehydratase n=1 Tax=Ophiostoma piceae (strain UAMH 11346) TaxID=1262450 RepID=S3BZL7_OPHP1|nr:3-hydroxybutyryl- dehydratase [Ophiostoma piceae UAMH 11346]